MEPFLFILLVVIAVALMVLGVILLRRVRTPLSRSMAIIAIATGALMVLTIVVGGFLTSRIVFGAVSFALLFGAGAAALVFWVATLIDCALNEAREGNEKLVWVVAV